MAGMWHVLLMHAIFSLGALCVQPVATARNMFPRGCGWGSGGVTFLAQQLQEVASPELTPCQVETGSAFHLCAVRTASTTLCCI